MFSFYVYTDNFVFNINVVVLLGKSIMQFKKNLKKYPWQLWAIIFTAVIVQMILFHYKELLHVDELFSFGTANGDKGVFLRYSAEEFDNQFFYKEDFKNYLLLQHSTFADMWHNLRLDTHMPLYFVLFRLFSIPVAPAFSLISVMTLNVLLFIVFLFGVYRLFMSLFCCKETAVVGVFIVAFMLPVLSLAVFMRMYLLWMVFCVYLVDYVVKYLFSDKWRTKGLIGIGIFSFLQILTHFYGLIFGFVLTVVGCLLLLIMKRYKQTACLAGVMLISVLCAWMVFPAMIDIGLHGERGVQFRARLPELVYALGSVLKYQMPLFIQTIFGHYLVAAVVFVIYFTVVSLGIKKKILSVEERIYIAFFSLIFVCYGVLSALFQPNMGCWQIRYFAPLIVMEVVLIIYTVSIICRLFEMKKFNFLLFLYLIAFVSAIYSAMVENAFWAKRDEVYAGNTYQRFENIFKDAHIWWGLGCSPVWMMHIVMDKLIETEQLFVLSDVNDPNFMRYAKQEKENGHYAYYFLPHTQEQAPEGAVIWIKEKTGRNSYYMFTFKDEKYGSFLAASVFLVAPY